MALDFKYTISERQYRDWIRLSNEDLIPKPLVLLFNFDSSDPGEQYWSDLQLELALQADLFDSDRKVVNVLVGGVMPETLPPALRRRLLNQIQSYYELVGARKFEAHDIPRNYFESGDLIAHGVSAIGRINHNFIQNINDPSRYSRSLQAGILPVDKGWKYHPLKTSKRKLTRRD